MSLLGDYRSHVSNPMLPSNENDGYVTLKVFKIQNKIPLFDKYFSYHYILMR